MFHKIYALFKCNKADMYIQMTICTIIFCIIASLAVQFIVVVNQKLWLDDKIQDMAHLISISGCYKDDDVISIQTDITTKMGGTFDFVGTILDTEAGTVQLGESIYINYTSTINVFEVGDDPIVIDVAISQLAVSEVYFKEN